MKIHTDRLRAGTPVEHIPDPLLLQSDTSEPIRIDKEMSTNSRTLAFFGKLETHFLFPFAKVQAEAPHSSRTTSLAIFYHKELLLPTDTLEIAKCAKPTYRCRILYGISPAAMHITQCFPDTEAWLNHVNKTPIPQPQKHRIHRGLLPKLRTEQPLHVKSKILLLFRFAFFCARV